MFFREPNIDELENSKKLKELKRALKYKKGNVRHNAAEALGRIGDNTCMKSLLRAMKKSKEGLFARNCAEALQKIGFTPKKDEIGALYWRYLDNPKECAECGPLAMNLILQMLLYSDFTCSKEEIIEAYLPFGLPGLIRLLQATELVYQKYKIFIRDTYKLDLIQDSELAKKEEIESLSERLGNCVEFISRFDNEGALNFNIHFYKRVIRQVHYASDSGFDDFFDACKIRKSIIESFKNFNYESYRNKMTKFMLYVIGEEEDLNVRHAAIKVVSEWPKEDVKVDEEKENLLKKAIHILITSKEIQHSDEKALAVKTE